MESLQQHFEHRLGRPRLDPEIVFETIVTDILKFIDTDIAYMSRVTVKDQAAEKSQVDTVNAFIVVVPEFYYITGYVG
jgi:hypothetical protein